MKNYVRYISSVLVNKFDVLHPDLAKFYLLVKHFSIQVPVSQCGEITYFVYFKRFFRVFFVS